jgi:hypothetical protein
MVAMTRDHGFIETAKRGEIGLRCGASAINSDGQAAVRPVTSKKENQVNDGKNEEEKFRRGKEYQKIMDKTARVEGPL